MFKGRQRPKGIVLIARGTYFRSLGEQLGLGTSICKRTDDMGNASEEMSVEVEHAQEVLQGRKVSEKRKGKDGLVPLSPRSR